MRKTSVYLSEEEVEGLRRLAVRKGLPQAELIREGVRRVIADADLEPREFRSLGKGHGGGRAHARWDPDALHDRVMGRR